LRLKINSLDDEGPALVLLQNKAIATMFQFEVVAITFVHIYVANLEIAPEACCTDETEEPSGTLAL